MSKQINDKHLREYFIEVLPDSQPPHSVCAWSPEALSVAIYPERMVHVREVVEGIDERWREKYYDKCEELNKAEGRIKELEKIIEDIEYGPRD